MQEYYPLPQPSEITIREREDAMGAYLTMFAAVAMGLPLPIINLIAAVVYFYINKKKSRFIHFHSLQSLLVQIPTTLINWGLAIWIIRIWFFDSTVNDYFYTYAIFAAVANISYFIFSLIATYRAYKGKMFYFIFFGAYTYNKVFKIKGNSNQEEYNQNNPPY